MTRPSSSTSAGPYARQSWVHDDGTPCPAFWSSRMTAENGQMWWCTEHQQHVRLSSLSPAPTTEEN